MVSLKHHPFSEHADLIMAALRDDSARAATGAINPMVRAWMARYGDLGDARQAMREEAAHLRYLARRDIEEGWYEEVSR